MGVLYGCAKNPATNICSEEYNINDIEAGAR